MSELSPYAATWETYADAGWYPFALKAKTKMPPPEGVTGARNPYPARSQMRRMAAMYPGGNIAIRMPRHVITLDIDARDGGLATLHEHLAKFGPLPPTVHSTARTEGDGQFLFTVPKGLTWPSGLGAGLQIVSWAYRYTVCWPSVNPKTGTTYQWFFEENIDTLGGIPMADDLPWLPDTWISGLQEQQKAARQRQGRSSRRLFTVLMETPRAREERLNAALNRVTGQREGDRNNLLNWAAHEVFKPVVDAGVLDYDSAFEVLEQAGREAGLDDSEIRATVHSGLNGGAR